MWNTSLRGGTTKQSSLTKIGQVGLLRFARNDVFGIIILSFIFILCSCVKQENPNEGLSIFKYNESAGILTLDPIYAKDLPHIWACNQLFSSLVALDEEMNVVPRIAHSWEISDDGTVYTFHLRNDVRFHEDVSIPEGRIVNAEDVCYSFNRVVDKSLNSPGSWIFSTVAHDDGHYSFQAIDDSTFQVKLSKPFPPFLGILSMTYASIVPKEAVEYYGDAFRSHPIGTGPFRFQYWNEGVKLVFRKNPTYFETDSIGERLPYLDAVSISFLIDRQVAFLEFIKGKFDFMSGIDARYKDELLTYDGELRQKYEDKIELITGPFLNTEYISFYIDPNDTLGVDRSRALRQAVNLCIDREKMLRYLRNGIGIPATGGMIPAGLPGHRDSIGYDYDLKKAQRLVKENRLEGYTLNLSTTAEYADIGKFVQAQAEQIGLKCKMEVMPPATVRSMRSNGSLSFFRASWVADYPDAENYLSLFTTSNFSPDGPNYSHYSNVKYDRLYDKAMACSDDELRASYYAEMDSLMMLDAPVVPLFYDEVLRFVNLRVKGLGSNPTNLLDLRTVKME